MNEMDLQQMIRTTDFVNQFRTAEMTELLRGKFTRGKTPYLHTVFLSDGSRIVLRFTDTVRYMLDAKLKRRTDRQSYLSYMELCVFPAGLKGYCKTFDAKLVLITAPVDAALKKHQQNLDALRAEAGKFEIDLTAPESWSTVFDANYNRKSGL